MPRFLPLGVAAAAAALLALAGCGGTAHRLTVFAASSLSDALTRCGGDARLSFAGSDQLAAQIRQGLKPDVYAAANSDLPARLHADGLVTAPVAFATNELVLAVPAEGARVTSLAGLARPGVTIAIGSASVPVGSYTRTVLGRLPAGQRAAILRNVRSREPDVAGIVGKLTQAAVDAGFVYRSDVAAAAGRLRAIPLPERLRPRVVYAAAVVDGSDDPAAARRFVRGLRDGDCARALRSDGFGAAPR